MIHNIAIIGAGQLGSRYLQGVKLALLNYHIYVVDPNKNALIQAKKRYKSFDGTESNELTCTTNMKNLPKNLTICIISTTSDIRKQVLFDLLQIVNVKYMVLEKVVFQKVEDFEQVKELFRNKNIKSWVNLPRRTFPVYKEIKKKIQNQILNIKVSGNNWGLASNSIHMIDIFVFLTGQNNLKFDIKNLSRTKLLSKRKGYQELKGELEIVSSRGDVLQLLDTYKTNFENFNVLIQSDEKNFLIDEINKLEIIKQENYIKKILIPYQSEMTGSILDEIINTGYSSLVTFNECMGYHVEMLNAFNKQFSIINKKDIRSCPIT
jgi:predicted dehydrogenase